MLGNRIRELRKIQGLKQTTLGVILGTTQQTISRMENGLYDIPTDLLVQMAERFNVTTDYILGISEVKRDLGCQVRMNQEMNQHYDIVLRYKKLTEVNKKTFEVILERLEQAQLETEQGNGSPMPDKQKGR